MRQEKTKLPVILAVFLASALVAAAPAAFAWTRTITYTGPNAISLSPPTKIAFPSDSGSGVPSGNTATTIYIDFSTVGGTVATSATFQACGLAYNASGGGCGAFTTGTYPAGGIYDVSIGTWFGTGSVYDYFYVLIVNNNTGTLKPLGIGVVGT